MPCHKIGKCVYVKKTCVDTCRARGFSFRETSRNNPIYRDFCKYSAFPIYRRLFSLINSRKTPIARHSSPVTRGIGVFREILV